MRIHKYTKTAAVGSCWENKYSSKNIEWMDGQLAENFEDYKCLEMIPPYPIL